MIILLGIMFKKSNKSKMVINLIYELCNFCLKSSLIYQKHKGRLRTLHPWERLFSGISGKSPAGQLGD